MGLINCVAGTNNSSDEKLWDLINNNAYYQNSLLLKSFPGLSVQFGGCTLTKRVIWAT